MKTKTAELIEKNNELREKLSKENKAYYEDLLRYIRFTTFVKNEQEVESSLYQILQDILEAQADGVSAAEFFGKSPQESAKELVKSYSSSLKTFFKYVGIAFLFSSFFTVITVLTDKGGLMNPLAFVANGIMSVIVVLVIFAFFAKSIYNKFLSKKSVMFVVLFIIMILYLAASLTENYWLPKVFIVKVPPLMAIIILVAAAIIGTVYVLSKKKTERGTWLPFLPLLWVLCGVGILQKTQFGLAFLATTQGKIVSVGAVLISYIAYLLLARKDAKKSENQK